MATETKTLVNGQYMADKIGQKVTLYANISTVENGGTALKAKTSDEKDITILLNEPLSAPVTGWVEIQGSPASVNSIRCDKIISFELPEEPEDFDTEGYNNLVMLWNNAKNYFVSS